MRRRYDFFFSFFPFFLHLKKKQALRLKYCCARERRLSKVIVGKNKKQKQTNNHLVANQPPGLIVGAGERAGAVSKKEAVRRCDMLCTTLCAEYREFPQHRGRENLKKIEIKNKKKTLAVQHLDFDHY